MVLNIYIRKAGWLYEGEDSGAKRVPNVKAAKRDLVPWPHLPEHNMHFALVSTIITAILQPHLDGNQPRLGRPRISIKPANIERVRESLQE